MPVLPWLLTWFPSTSHRSLTQHITVTAAQSEGSGTHLRPPSGTKKAAYLLRKADPPGAHVLAGCLQFTLTSWDRRKFESRGDKAGCLNATVCDKDVVSIANTTSVPRTNRWGLVGGEITAARF